MAERSTSDAGAAPGSRGLRIGRKHLRSLDSFALQAYPEECCGVLLGRSGAVIEIWPAANSHDGPRSTRYAIDPAELLRAYKTAREADLEVIGYYHSHPDGSAMPSDTDLATALPDVSYLILGVSSERVIERRSWSLRVGMKGFIEEEIE